MDTGLITTVFGVIATIATLVATAFGLLWRRGEKAQNDLVVALRAQALSSETRAISSDQRAIAAEARFTRLVSEFKINVVALNKASIAFDPGALVGSVPPPPGVEEPTGVYFAEGRRARAVILDDREEFARKREPPLNPEAERRERDRIAKLSRNYVLEDSDRPPRRR